MRRRWTRSGLVKWVAATIAAVALLAMSANSAADAGSAQPALGGLSLPLPEPTTLAVLGGGLIMMAGLYRHVRNRRR